MFSSLREKRKKRDSDGLSASSGASKNSEPKTKAPSFSLSRLFPNRRRSKSRLSLDSELSRSDNGACSSPYQRGDPRSSPPLSSVVHLGYYYSTMSVGGQSGNEPSDGAPVSESGIDSSLYASKEAALETSLSDLDPAAADKRGAELIECPVCLLDKPKTCFLEVSTCHHRCCSKCLKEYFRIEIMESRVAIACPECSELFHPNDIESIVQDPPLMHKYQDFMLRRVLAIDSDTRWCPAPDCGYAVIATGCAGCPKLKCEREGCGTFFCYHCKQHWHPSQTCEDARIERSPDIMRSSSVSYSHQNEIKPCPRCGAFIVKMDDGSCNHMTCAVCGAGFCWLCMQEISDLHYLSPSGCTFWGRKPWSRKKKIFWQLGTLVGAPVGITLVAGIAVPAMIIGIPVWVGRKIHFRYDKASKHKRNLAITAGVTASVLAAPVVAGLTVGIGVPILLAYVYGVVPFSLCRSGGCGVTTTNTGGVRFDFDENEQNPQGPYSLAGDNQSMETATNVANPSIAPSIGDASLGMTNSLSASGSHMERAGCDVSDRDSSSHRAIAGNSINGSLCSATYSALHHKLEVRADISEPAALCEQSSVGGESYNMSLTDDASTRALAGSIISPKDKDGISLCSRHFEPPPPYSEVESSGKLSEDHSGRGSNSCPTSPQLRKASPAPSEEARGSGRGKKCTRFMDQVSEIESHGNDGLSLGELQSDMEGKGGDCVSLRSVLSSTSGCSVSPEATTVSVLTSAGGDDPSGNNPGLSVSCLTGNNGMSSTSSLVINNAESVSSLAGHTAMSSVSSLGHNAMSSVSSVSPSDAEEDVAEGLASCESLLSEGAPPRCGRISLGGGGRVKAESTSVLNTGADSRRSEMGGARRRSDCCYRDDLNATVSRSLARKKSTPRDKEHRSQPGNLSDISEMKGMPVLHSAGLSDLLAVVDTSCENVFLDCACQTKGRLVSCSSSEDQSEAFPSVKCLCPTHEENENCAGSGDEMMPVGGSGIPPESLGLATRTKLYSNHDGRFMKKRQLLEVYTTSARRHAERTSGVGVSETLEQTTSICSGDKRDACQVCATIANDRASSSLPAVERPLSRKDIADDSPRSDTILESTL